MSTPQQALDEIRPWVVNYYGKNFYLTTKQRNALLDAKARGKDMVQIDQYTLSTTFTWMMPVEEIEPDRLSTEEEMVVNKIVNWMDRPAQDLTMNRDQIYNYAVKVVKRIGSAHAMRLYEEYANGDYPSVRGFMSAFNQFEYDQQHDIIKQNRIGTTHGFEQIMQG